jgi:hypothetical protein
VNTVWIRGQADVLVRADFIVLLAIAHGGLTAECVGGLRVRLADSECPGALQLALLDEIRRAGSDDRHAVVITPPAEQHSAIWRHEYADTLVDLLTKHQGELAARGTSTSPHARSPGRGEASSRCGFRHYVASAPLALGLPGVPHDLARHVAALPRPMRDVRADPAP